MMPWHKTGIRWSVVVSLDTFLNVSMSFLKIQGQTLPWRLRISGLVVGLASVGLTVRANMRKQKTKTLKRSEERG